MKGAMCGGIPGGGYDPGMEKGGGDPIVDEELVEVSELGLLESGFTFSALEMAEEASGDFIGATGAASADTEEGDSMGVDCWPGAA